MQNSVNHRIKTYSLPITVLTVYVLLTWWAETSICPIRAMTGLPCPGCGLTTAATALLRGDILTALQSNAMIFIVPPVLMLAVIDVCKKNPARFRITRWIYLSTALIMFIYFAVRMTMYFPGGNYPMNIDDHTIPRKAFSLFN